MSWRESHEGRACDAVLRHIEQREGAQRSNMRSPERSRHPAPIDLACEIAGRAYAFEHTGVEPFAGQISNDVFFGQQMQRIADRIRPPVPANEHWELVIAADAMAGMSVAPHSDEQNNAEGQHAGAQALKLHVAGRSFSTINVVVVDRV